MFKNYFLFLFIANSHAALPSIHERFYDPLVTDQAIVTELAEVLDPKAMLRSMLPGVTSRLFTTQSGQMGSFDFQVPGYDLRHALSYYIPRSISLSSVTTLLPALIFLHGGGTSTANYQAAKNVAETYLQDFISFAETNRVILLFPSSSIGWGFQTRFLVREVARIARTELPIDPDRIVISGHSMGAMGIGRDYAYLSDQATALLALAGRIPPAYSSLDRLKTVFNMKYTQINGEQDHFQDFAPTMREFEMRVRATERELGLTSGFTLLFHPGGHNYDLGLTYSNLRGLFETRRDLYQRNLFAVFFGADYPGEGNNPPFPGAILNRFHWMEIRDYPLPVGSQKLPAFEGRITGNEIRIQTVVNDIQARTVRLYLSREMLDLTRPVSVFIDGRLCFQGSVTTGLAETIRIARAMRDASFLYDGSIDVPLTCAQVSPALANR